MAGSTATAPLARPTAQRPTSPRRVKFDAYNLGVQRRKNRPTMMLQPPIGPTDPVPNLEALPEDLSAAICASVGKALMVDCNGQTCEPIGSGSMWPIVVGDRLLFVTNDHVGGSVQKVIWLSADEKVQVETTLLGTDPKYDLSVMEPVSADVPSTLRPFVFSPVGLKAGDPVIAVGCPFGLPPMQTHGRVSMITSLVGDPDGDLVPDLICHGANINPGNSGGPLVDALGRVHGVNTFGVMGSGIGFSVPVALVARLLEELPENSQTAWLAEGLLVTDTPYGPVVQIAPKAGRFFHRDRAHIREVTQFRDVAESKDVATQQKLATIRRTEPIYAPQLAHAREFSFLTGVNGEEVLSVAEALQIVAAAKKHGKKKGTFEFRKGTDTILQTPTVGVSLSFTA